MPPSSAAVASQLAAYNAKPVTSTDALNSALSQYGVPEIRQNVAGLRTTVANTTNALNSVDPSVTGRTQGSLVTEAQRAKQVNNERAPIAQQLHDQSQTLGQNEQDLNTALGQATTTATNKVNDYTAGRAALEGEYNTAYQREQNDRNYGLEQQKLAAGSGTSDIGALMAALTGGQNGGGNQTSQQTQGVVPAPVQRPDKGFNYVDHNGNAINAAQYAHLTGQNFRDVLTKAAAAGDLGSKQALSFVGNDYGYDPTKVTNQNLANLYKALTGQGATIFAPKPNYNIATGQGAQNVHNAIVSGAKKAPGTILSKIGTFGSGGSSVQKQLAAARAAGKVK